MVHRRSRNEFNNRNRLWITAALGSLLLLLSYNLYFPITSTDTKGISIFDTEVTDKRSTKGINIEELSKIDRKQARSEYFLRMTRDPATGRVPAGARNKELAYARNLDDQTNSLLRKATADFEWEEIGPYNIGGRTRALAVDQTNNDIIIAGGVSGGIWKSTDGGQTWEMKTDPSQNMSVTSLAQDPRDGHTDTWYYSAGELLGNSASARSARYYGTGIFKSTDNGETWQRLESTLDKDKSFSGPFDYTSSIKIHPETGDIFLASNGFGILRSTDGQNFSTVLGGPGKYLYADVEMAPNGKLAAALSTENAGVSRETDDPTGILISDDNGESWTNVTPDNFPDSHERTVLALAPSNPDILYTFSYLTGEGEDEEVAFFKFDLGAGTAEDRSDNMPDFNIERGFVNTQTGYNMVLGVKPGNPDFVLLGATNLFRSTDGFATQPTDNKEAWIGGYGNGTTEGSDGAGGYPNQHADQHALVFDPSNPDRLWVGHDGGLSLTEDINATPVEWDDMNNGYNVTQYYTIDLPDASEDNRIIGGTQDNGSPFFRYSNDSQRNSAFDAFGGDGAFAQFALREDLDQDYIFLSSQNGNTYRTTLGFTGTPQESNYVKIAPDAVENQLFIHPSALDPVTKNIFYYPSNRVIWRNTNVLNDAFNWNKLDSVNVPEGYRISTLSVSKQPANVLYYAGYNEEKSPVIYRLDDAHQDTTGAVDVSIDEAEAGTWIHTIDINPNNADEVMVAISNYGVISSIYHTTNGGESWTAVGGNLVASETDDWVGPSVRTVKILPLGNGDKVFLAGTSTGLYASGSLSGTSTEWVHQAENKIGYSVIEAMDVRPSDGLVAAATHGRGIFLGTHSTFTDIAGGDDMARPGEFELAKNYPNPFNPSTNISFKLPSTSEVTVTVYNSNGREVQTLAGGRTFGAGQHQLSFNGSSLASGTYIYRIEARATNSGRSFTKTRTMTLIK